MDKKGITAAIKRREQINKCQHETYTIPAPQSPTGQTIKACRRCPMQIPVKEY